MRGCSRVATVFLCAWSISAASAAVRSETGGSEEMRPGRLVAVGLADDIPDPNGLVLIGDNTCAGAHTLSCGNQVALRFQTPMAEDYEKSFSCLPTSVIPPPPWPLPQRSERSGYALDTIWVKFVATASYAKISLCGQSTALVQDLVLAVYRTTNPASPCGGNLVEIACENGSGACGAGLIPGLLEEKIVGGLTVGQTYWVQVGALEWTGGVCGTGPCTQGQYRLMLTCADDLSCEIGAGGYQPEAEYEPCNPTKHVNDGCKMYPHAFAAIACGEARHGTTALYGGVRDTDWYRLVLNDPGQSYPTQLTMTVAAEFVPDLYILKPGQGGDRCDGFEIVAASDPNAFVVCGPAAAISCTANGPGEYWLVVTPDVQFGTVECGRDYLVTVQSSACYPALGACCTGASCFVLAREDCNPSTSVYYGDGTTCVGGMCYICPTPYSAEGESYACPGHGHVDWFNGGCSFSTAAPPFKVIVPGTTYCGTSGTHFNAPPLNASENRRDEDWYRFDLTGVPVGELRAVTITIRTEFPAEVMLVNPDLGLYGCDQLVERTVLDRIITAGEEYALTACVEKRSGTPQLGDVWVVIRPAEWGTPFEIPCGSRYWFKASVGLCAVTGACCVVNTAGEPSGCTPSTPLLCANAGGRFLGVGSTCAGGCCPCVPGQVPEGEPHCGLLGGNNSGCDTPLAPAFNSVGLALPGSAACGTARWDDDGYDSDWYAYQHPGGELVFTVRADFSPMLAVVKPGPTGTCLGREILAQASGGECNTVELRIAALPPGDYWLRVAPHPMLNLPFGCGAPYTAWVAAFDPEGACCFMTGNCQVMPASVCLASGGTYMGAGVACLPDLCPPGGACCYANGSCEVWTQAACSGAWQGPGTDCMPNDCPQPPVGACCFGDTCVVRQQPDCTGTWLGPCSSCEPNLCPLLCLGDTDCDGDADFFDIDPFVAKLGCPGIDPCGCSADCPWKNADVDGDGDVDFFDIDPFVARLGVPCPSK